MAKLEPRSVVGALQIHGLKGLTGSAKKTAIYAAHTEQAGYKKMKVHSAYLGEVEVDVYDAGNGWVAMQTIVKGMSGRPDIFVKEIDATRHRLRPDKYEYNINYLAQIQPTFVNVSKCAHYHRIIEILETKKKLAEMSGGALSRSEQNQLHASYIHNNVVDIHFNSCNYLEFLHKYIGDNNVTNNNILLSMHNIKRLDNAFWTGGHMVYGNGDRMFHPLGTSDVGGHEAGHGCVQNTAGLKYRGHSGALNESFADILGVCFEFYLYYKYNNNKDGNTSDDIKGVSDWTIGEDSGKSIKYLRNMADPHMADNPQPKHYRGKYWGNPNDSTDYGYVHGNSGVGNFCFYNVACKIGWERALCIFWKCLQQLGPDSSYIDFRDYLKLVSDTDLSVVADALQTVGLNDNAVTDWQC
jgi:Zn-dependent metalloprotease